MGLLACASEISGKGTEVGAITDGPADSASSLILHTGPIQFDPVSVTIGDKFQAEAFPVVLTSSETVTIRTSKKAQSDVDTVLYLYKKGAQGFGRYINKNDDESTESVFSAINVKLDAGEYRVIVKPYDRKVRGEFQLSVTCADGLCEAPEHYDWCPKCDDNQLSPGEVVFRVPLLDWNGKLMSRFNEQLTAAGLETFPDYVDISNQDIDAGRARFQHFIELSSSEKVYQLTGETDMVAYDAFNNYQVEGRSTTETGLCYLGDALKAGALVQQLADGVLSDMFDLYGWRAKDQYWLHEDSAGGEALSDEWSNDVRDEWKSFDKTSTDILFLFGDDDEGEPQTDRLFLCK